MNLFKIREDWIVNLDLVVAMKKNDAGEVHLFAPQDDSMSNLVLIAYIAPGNLADEVWERLSMLPVAI